MSLLSKIILSKQILNNVKRTYSQKVYTDIIYERLKGVDSSIAVLGMNRPKQKNAFSLNLVTEFEENLNFVQHETDVRVLIIRSLTPGIFCAGNNN